MDRRSCSPHSIKSKTNKASARQIRAELDVLVRSNPPSTTLFDEIVVIDIYSHQQDQYNNSSNSNSMMMVSPLGMSSPSRRMSSPSKASSIRERFALLQQSGGGSISNVSVSRSPPQRLKQQPSFRKPTRVHSASASSSSRSLCLAAPNLAEDDDGDVLETHSCCVPEEQSKVMQRSRETTTTTKSSPPGIQRRWSFVSLSSSSSATTSTSLPPPPSRRASLDNYNNTSNNMMTKITVDPYSQSPQQQQQQQQQQHSPEQRRLSTSADDSKNDYDGPEQASSSNRVDKKKKRGFRSRLLRTFSMRSTSNAKRRNQPQQQQHTQHQQQQQQQNQPGTCGATKVNSKDSVTTTNHRQSCSQGSLVGRTASRQCDIVVETPLVADTMDRLEPVEVVMVDYESGGIHHSHSLIKGQHDEVPQVPTMTTIDDEDDDNLSYASGFTQWGQGGGGDDMTTLSMDDALLRSHSSSMYPFSSSSSVGPTCLSSSASSPFSSSYAAAVEEIDRRKAMERTLSDSALLVHHNSSNNNNNKSNKKNKTTNSRKKDSSSSSNNNSTTKVAKDGAAIDPWQEMHPKKQGFWTRFWRLGRRRTSRSSSKSLSSSKQPPPGSRTNPKTSRRGTLTTVPTLDMDCSGSSEDWELLDFKTMNARVHEQQQQQLATEPPLEEEEDTSTTAPDPFDIVWDAAAGLVNGRATSVASDMTTTTTTDSVEQVSPVTTKRGNNDSDKSMEREKEPVGDLEASLPTTTNTTTWPPVPPFSRMTLASENNNVNDPCSTFPIPFSPLASPRKSCLRRPPSSAAAGGDDDVDNKHMEEKEEDDDAARRSSTKKDMSTPSGNNSVQFSVVQVREYERTVGDHPSCTAGPPMGLGWSYVAVCPDVLVVEHAARPKRRKKEFHIPASLRTALLKEEWNIPEADLRKARREVAYIQYCREQTAFTGYPNPPRIRRPSHDTGMDPISGGATQPKMGGSNAALLRKAIAMATAANDDNYSTTKEEKQDDDVVYAKIVGDDYATVDDDDNDDGFDWDPQTVVRSRFQSMATARLRFPSTRIHC